MMRCWKLEKTGASRRMPPFAHRLFRVFQAASAPTTTANFWNTSQKSGWRAGTVGGDTRIYTEITSFRFSPGIAPRRNHSHTGSVVVVAVANSSNLCGFDHLTQRPYSLRDSCCHRRSRSQRPVNSAEVVPSEVQRQHRPEICSLFRESICKASESANLHPHREVLPFDVRCADFAENWVSPLWDRHGVHNFRRGIIALPIGGSGVHLDQLRIIDARSQTVVNGFDVRPESIRCELESACRRFVQLFNESIGISRRSPSEMPRENQLGVTFDGDETIGVAAFRVARQIPLFFAADESPQFIALYFGDADRADSIFKKAVALLANKNEQGKNRGVVNSSDALDGVYRASLDKQFEHADRGVQRRAHSAEWRGVFFGESLAALTAAEALKPVAVFPEPFTLDTAVAARHGLSPSCVSAGEALNSDFRFESGLVPLLNHAPSSVTADDGVFHLPQRIHTEKSEWSSCIGTPNFALLKKPLQNRIKEGQRISDSVEFVSPRCESIPHFNCGHRMPNGLIQDRSHEIRPCDFGLHLLSKRVLKPYRSGFQLGDFSVELIALAHLGNDSRSHIDECFLEGCCHG